jgi:hypothetical protein
MKKKTYLMEIESGTDKFMVYSKAFYKYYIPLLSQPISFEELKHNYTFDLEREFGKKRAKYKNKQAKIK